MSASNQALAPYRSRGLALVPDHDAVRNGRYVGVPLQCERLPERCIFCNADAGAYRKIAHVGDTQWVEVPLCPRHRRLQAMGQPLMRLGMVASAVAFFVSIVAPWWLGLAGMLLALASVFVGNHLRTVVRGGWNDGTRMWMRAGRAFVSSIPKREGD